MKHLTLNNPARCRKLAGKCSIRCPVCGGEVEPEMDECPDCGLDKMLMDDAKAILEEDESTPEKEDENLQEENDEDFSIDEDEIDYEEVNEEITVFICPLCDSEVEEHMNECPSCGAIFEEDDEEEDEEIYETTEKDEERDIDELDDLLESLEEDPEEKQKDPEKEKEKKLEETFSFLDEEEESEEHEKEEELDDIDQALQDLEELAFEEDEDLEEDRVEEEIERKEELEERLRNAENRLARFQKEDISLKRAEELIEQSQEHIDSNRFDEAEGTIQRSKELAEKGETFLKRLKEIEEKLDKFEDKIKGVEDLQDRIEEAKIRLEKNDHETALNELEKIDSSIEEKKKRYQTTSEKKEDINELITQLDSTLDAGKRMDLSLKRERKLISKALVASKKGNVDKAVEWLTQAHKRSRKKIEDELSEEIETLKDSIMGSKASEKEDLKERLVRLEDAKMEREYRRSVELVNELKKLVEEQGEMEDERLAKLKDYIHRAKKLGVDVEEAEETLEEVQEKDIELHVELAQKELEKTIPKALPQIMKEGLKKLEEAKKNDIDITKAVTHLKRANLMMKKSKYFEALNHMYSFNESIPSEEENEEEKETVKVQSQTKKEKPEPKKKTVELDRPSKTSTSREKIGESTRGEVPTDLESGSTYLFIEKKPDLSQKAFAELLNSDPRKDGMCITRRYPDKIKKKYDLDSDVSVLWLSDIDQKEALNAKNLERLSLEIERFLSKGNELLLFGGLEYLISKNGFKTVFNLLQSFKDQVAVSNSIMLITVSPNTFEKNQLELLEKEVDETYRE